MLGSHARWVMFVTLLCVTQGGCQSWFLIQGGDLMPQWEELRREGAEVDLYVVTPLSNPAAASAAGTASAPGNARSTPLSRVSLGKLLPTRPPFVVGLREPDEQLVMVDSRRVAHAHALRNDPQKVRLGLGIAFGSVAVLGALSGLLVGVAVLTQPGCLGHPCGI